MVSLGITYVNLSFRDFWIKSFCYFGLFDVGLLDIGVLVSDFLRSHVAHSLKENDLTFSLVAVANWYHPIKCNITDNLQNG